MTARSFVSSPEGLAEAIAEYVYKERLIAAIVDVERSFARSQTDTLANRTALLVHNVWRQKAGLPRIRPSDLPEYIGEKGHGHYEVRPLPLEPR